MLYTTIKSRIDKYVPCATLFVVLILCSCESREEKFEREARENITILKKIEDSLSLDRQISIQKNLDTLASDVINTYGMLASAYYLEKGEFSCVKDSIQYLVAESFVNYACNPETGVASFRFLTGDCKQDSVGVKPLIENGAMNYHYEFESETCERAIRPLLSTVKNEPPPQIRRKAR